MFLSRLRIDGAAAVNPYEVHRLLWTAFPAMPQASRPYLFRVMPERGRAVRDVLMQSTCEPVQPKDSRAVLAACRGYSPGFEAGQRLFFETCVNPVKRLAGSGDRVPLIRDEDRLAWLRRQMDGAAEVESGNIAASERLYFRKPGMRPGTIETAVISGALRVKDPAGFLEICRDGIGPAKSFGCGLLLLGRA